ncbi:unnamed protein product [Lupinus luteus]|uniref:Uncharacterized protein n=1 Tax=Lupinus luteus TaxID=3873 RepID=A0AAV1X8S1_LUPLU
MVSDGSYNLSVEKSFRIKEDDRFFSRLMSKETSMANTSSRIFYYGETSVAVPFIWEAQPGTPKHPLSETYLPPLTPPPSYFPISKSLHRQRNSKTNIISCILPRFSGSKKSANVSSPLSSRSPSPSSSSSTWSLSVYPSSSYSSKDNDKGNRSFSNLKAFGSLFKHRASNGFRGCYAFRKMKNAILSHGGRV